MSSDFFFDFPLPQAPRLLLIDHIIPQTPRPTAGHLILDGTSPFYQVILFQAEKTDEVALLRLFCVRHERNKFISKLVSNSSETSARQTNGQQPALFPIIIFMLFVWGVVRFFWISGNRYARALSLCCHVVRETLGNNKNGEKKNFGSGDERRVASREKNSQEENNTPRQMVKDPNKQRVSVADAIRFLAFSFGRARACEREEIN